VLPTPVSMVGPVFHEHVLSCETRHPIWGYLAACLILFAVLFPLATFALVLSTWTALGSSAPISVVTPAGRYLMLFGWRGAPRPARWRNDRRYYRGPLR